MNDAYVGVAGWSIPNDYKQRGPSEDSHLERYGAALSCVEINSSFYREHKFETYARWAASVPDNFRFSAKLSKYFTHDQRLKVFGTALRDKLAGMAGLGDKLRIILVQLPPSLEFDAGSAEKFISKLSEYSSRLKIAWEPRHISWADKNAVRLMADYGVSKVLADPERCPTTASQRKTLETKLRYYRLHGSPVIYRSSYSPDVLARIAGKIRIPLFPAEETWLIFDNTTLGHGFANALDLQDMMSKKK